MSRWHRFLLAFDRRYAECLVVLGLIVDYLQANTAWAAYLGKWGGLATVAIGVCAILLRIARDKAPTT
jgi:hypothetical protein